ncbi:uncharacterized protein C2orf78 homolog [Peromyscus eremicus]|uniref:uncharacterized protein C2orf78 homolog n=1 Tax=Peromyscus eremicus TaxID=42410 RepID=UPI0027DDAA4D|nr:uncharacterized protein C2orf78 homolog [Peromyscus eremicus]XP_059133031.1 uncharacterized protein C2orf78 homolog [Peromyscus eremicus]XP_059133038.1 uncharacterized protein C2orf78 homolog [Peromyscus eremicus]
MAENYQSAPFFGTECALQPSAPVLRNATPLAGSVCNFSRVSTPALSSAWLLPSDSSTCCQQLMDSAYPYLPAGTTMVTALTDQGQSSASALSYLGVLQWDPTGGTDRRGAALQDFTVTVIDQNTTFSSLSMTAQGDNILDPNSLVLSYPILSASLVQATPPQVSNQGYSLAPSYQEGSQVYYNDVNSLGPLMAGELRQCLQACGSVSYSGGQASALQPGMVVMPKEIQPMNVQTPFTTSAIYYPTPAQDMPDTSLQVVKMETTLGLTASGQTLCLLQSPDLCNACTQDVQKTPPVHGDWSLTAPIDSFLEFLPLPPALSLEQTENNDLDLMTADLSTPLYAYEGIKESQDPSLLPLAHANMQQALNSTDSGNLKQKLSPDNATLGSSSLGQDEPGVLQSVMGSSMDFADMTTLVADIHLPRLFNSITEMNQFQDPTATQSKDTRRDQAQESSSIISVSVNQVRKNSQKSSEMLDGSPQARIQLQGLVEEEEAVGSAGSSEGAIDNMPKHLEGKAQKTTPNMPSRARAQGQDKTKRTRENNSKKTEELKQSRNIVKAEENTTMPKNKRKRNPPELSHNSFKKPRTHLGMHMLESVQVFHPLGKKSEKKTGISSSQARLNLSKNKDPRTGPATTSLLDVPSDGRGPGKTPSNAQRPESNAHRECPSPSQYELPPPGKVKLVPLPFPALDKPQARLVSRKPLSLASHRPPAVYPARPHSHSAQPTTLKPSKPAPASTSLMASDKPALPIATRDTRANITNPIQSCPGPQPAVCRPLSYRASSHPSLQRELDSSNKNKAPSTPKPQIQYLLQDFSHQPIPWRKVHIPGPVISQPITEEQRPEREAMKRQAQRERENAAKFTSLGKPQLFLQKQKDMEISTYFGYVM